MPDHYVSTITRKGQITIPVDLRREFAVGEGDTVEFVRTVDGEIILKLRSSQQVDDLPLRSEAARAIQAIARRYRPSEPATIEQMKEAAAEGWTERERRYLAERDQPSGS